MGPQRLSVGLVFGSVGHIVLSGLVNVRGIMIYKLTHCDPGSLKEAISIRQSYQSVRPSVISILNISIKYDGSIADLLSLVLNQFGSNSYGDILQADYDARGGCLANLCIGCTHKLEDEEADKRPENVAFSDSGTVNTAYLAAE